MGLGFLPRPYHKITIQEIGINKLPTTNTSLNPSVNPQPNQTAAPA